MSERRSSNRLEQFSVSARFEHADHNYSGFVLDSSDHGIAVTVPKSTALPEEGSPGILFLKNMKNGSSDAKEHEAGTAEVTRIWMNDDDWGYAHLPSRYPSLKSKRCSSVELDSNKGYNDKPNYQQKR